MSGGRGLSGCRVCFTHRQDCARRLLHHSFGDAAHEHVRQPRPSMGAHDDLDVVPELVAAIRSRYDLTENDQSLTAAATSRPAA